MSSRKLYIIFGILAVVVLAVVCQSQYMTSAKVYLQQNETDSAIAALEKEIAANPTNGEAYMIMADCLHSKQRYVEISDYFDLALQNNPELEEKVGAKREEMWQPFFTRGASMVTAGRTEQALKVYGIAQDIYPNKPDTYYALGYIHYQKGNVDLAIENWEASVERGILANKANAPVLRNLGNAYFVKQNWEKATERLQTYIEQYQPDDVDAMLNLAMSYDQIGQQYYTDGDTVKGKEFDQKVMNLMEDASKTAPDNPTVAHDAGLTLFRANRYELAIPYFEKVMELEPTDKENLKLLSMCHFRSKNLEKAAEISFKVIELDPEDHIAMRNLGIILGQMGRSEEALEMIQKADEIKKMKDERATGQNP
jgi:tetratricopeptide (TPR) repeat protein